jgi:hypothetical protein
MSLPYSEGTIFLVPLGGGGYARGVVVRTASESREMLGYFFGPPIETATAVAISDLRPENAICCLRFSDLGLISRAWPVVGTIPDWKPSAWPVPTRYSKASSILPKRGRYF